MQEKALVEFISESSINRNRRIPEAGLFELTYRCNLDCVYCYCKGTRDLDRELATGELKNILDQIHKEGCLEITFSGGEPLIREDFSEIYLYAKTKGFLINIFTNGVLLTEEKQKFLQKYPPRSIEITLNGITKETYESITRVKDSFFKVMENIKKIKEKKLPLILKANCLKQNKDEIVKIKAFADELLGKRRGRYHFKYDPMIYPRLNQDKTPTNFRLSFKELLELRREDMDIWQEYQKGLNADFPDLRRNKDFLYRCSSWRQQFFINPYGRLKFCQFSDKFSTDLKISTFKEGFYNIFPKLLNEKFKTNSKCKNCQLRPICYHCPARAYLETGDEEAPVPYYCELAKATYREMKRSCKSYVVSRK